MAIGFDGNTECLRIALSIPESASDSGQQQLNASVLTGTPAYRESIGPTYRRRLA